MSAYNASKYIDDAITSILDQRFDNFEFIIINDGSTDDTLRKIKKYHDARIVIIDQSNQGLVSSLNKGIAKARAPIIARQDADDISLPDRLRLQYEALSGDDSLVIIGSSIITINENGTKLNQHKVLLENKELKQELMIRSPFAHGSVMFRKKAFERARKYQNNDWPAEDYGLWLRMADCGTFANTDAALYKYRENSQGISAQNEARQRGKTAEIQKRAWVKCAKLQPVHLNVSKYRNVPMGEYRIDRIYNNTISILRQASKHPGLYTATKSLLPIFTSIILTKKFLRYLLIKLKLKHV